MLPWHTPMENGTVRGRAADRVKLKSVSIWFVTK